MEDEVLVKLGLGITFGEPSKKSHTPENGHCYSMNVFRGRKFIYAACWDDKNEWLEDANGKIICKITERIY